jgi:hypothetical protein
MEVIVWFIALVLPRVCRVPARDLWTHMLTMYCHFQPFFLTPKKDAMWIMGFVRIASFVSYRNFLFWPIRMKYDLSFCQDACLGIQQISKHTFVNSINEMLCLTYRVLLLLLYQAQQLYHIPSLHLAVCPVPTVVLRTMINETYCICITSLKMHVDTDMFNKVQIHLRAVLNS